MDEKTQKERLEQELRFLKESFEAEVISKEEFEKGKERIEKKLKELQSIPTEQLSEEQKKWQSIEKSMKTEAAKPEEQKKDDTLIKREGEKIKLKVIQDDVEEHEHTETIQKAEQKEQQKESIQEKLVSVEEPKKKSKFSKYAAVFIILTLIVFFSYSFFKGSKSQEKTNEIKFVAACTSNDDCQQEGKIGICLNSATKKAKCEFREIPKTNVIVLNDKKDCFNCDTQRVLNILESWFGAINSKEIDYNADEGKKVAEKFDARLLPMYILDGDVTTKAKFEEFKRVFVKKTAAIF